ncbi:FCD domain-containing protein [Streptomyces sennicomposti]|uniref:FCD domain-containing protein n=1 Tax=Streptomyces sennicomposti TaxID=2873384 RepID=UPI001CA65BFC|nr:FCD domain-containing protein [Streptomyces sennicomposti]MBY8869282.1 FCD domain-containing protein [Streptomyces sennicomposti]
MKQGAQDSAGPAGAAPGAPRLPRQAAGTRERHASAPEAARGEHTHGEGAHGRPAHGDSAQGRPAQDRPAQGGPAQDRPAHGLPAQGDSAYGLPARGDGAPGDGAPGDGASGGQPLGEQSAGERPAGEWPAREASAVPPGPVVRRSSVRGQVLAALRTALATGELRPGEVYSGPVLGERFGVSATPVREAMQQLALEGAVEVVPNRGFRVVERGARELAELAEVRALLEVPVLLRLAGTVPVERWAALRPLAEATVRAASSGCPAAYAESDRAFHHALLSLSGNEQLVRIAADLHRRTQRPPAAAPALLADATDHTALLDALIARDLDTVRTLLHGHVTGSR